jgi:hypothetical protein
MKNVATISGQSVSRPDCLRDADGDATERFGFRLKRLAVGNSDHAELEVLAGINTLRLGGKLWHVTSRENSLP